MTHGALFWVGLVVIISSAGLGASFGLEGVLFPAASFASVLVLVVFASLMRREGPSTRVSGAAPRRRESRAEPNEPSEPNARDLAASRRDMQWLIISALLIRMVVALVLNLSGAARKLAPDSYGYQLYGELIAAAWEDPRINPSSIRGYKPLSLYQNLNGISAYFFGEYGSLVVSFINCFIGVWGCLVTSKLAELMYGPKAGRRAFMLAAFFPSLILWTSINLRDGWSFLVVMSAILSVQRLRHGVNTRDALMFAAAMFVMPFIRPYMVILTVAGISVSFLATQIRQIHYAIPTLLLVFGLFYAINARFKLQVDLADPAANLEYMQKIKTGMAKRGETAYDRNVDISTPTGALLYMPRGLVQFLLTPFPWTIAKPRQAFALLETLYWYVVLFAGVRGMFREVRRRFSYVAVPLFTTLVITTAYTLIEGNAGTAYRHRAQVLLLFFVFAAGDYAEKSRRTVRQRAPELVEV